MATDSSNQYLSEISTQWSLLQKAHSDRQDVASPAQMQMLLRYSGAIQRYLLGALRDPEAAQELSQEFAFRFVRGDFQGADPERGRFRDYLKTVLFRMVANYFKQRNQQPRPLPDVVADPLATPPEGPDPERAFLDVWRGELMDRAWQSLAQIQKQTGQPYETVLRMKVDSVGTNLSSGQMAEELRHQFGRTFTSDGVRKLLQRAREKFAQFLLEDVAHSLQNPSPHQLELELRELGFLAYCRPALERRSE
ncbi:MAG TPA: hypothetical protein VKI65_02485 [Gemmataceae bacterium]|nr:hypothetical protein [Gemmataceae bacterium]